MRLALVGVVSGFLFCSAAAAQDLPTTHDHGITITPDHLADAIQETQDYWTPVRKHLLGAECTLGEVDPRTRAVAFLKSVHDGLHERLFNKTEAEAMDLITFLGHRLRMFEVYRRIRTTVGDDALTLSLVQTFQRELRSIQQLPPADRTAKLQALVDGLTVEMERHGVTGEKLVAARQLWDLQAKVVEQIAATDAGKMMIAFETEASKLDLQVGELLLCISTASDWVLIIREQGRPIGCDEFLKAVGEVQSVQAKQTAAGKPTLTR
jgi:hypothetical protein